MIYDDDNIHDWIEKVALSPDLKRRAAKKALERLQRIDREVTGGSASGRLGRQQIYASNRRERQFRLFKGKGPAPYPKNEIAGARETKAVEKSIGIKHSKPKAKPSKPAPDSRKRKGVSKLMLGGGALAAGGAGYGLAKKSHVYSHDNIHEALEKVAAHQGKRNLGDFVGAVAGAGAGLTAAEKLLRKRLKLPGAAIAGLGGSLLGVEGSRALRSGARRREMRRRGAEAQEYLRQVRKSKRLARGLRGTGGK